ncbi:MAG: hypothetical protein AAF720_13955 [Pseudomonadota bacterium]
MKKLLSAALIGAGTLLSSFSAFAQLNPNDVAFAVAGLTSVQPVEASRVIADYQAQPGTIQFLSRTEGGALVVINFSECTQGGMGIACNFVQFSSTYNNPGNRIGLQGVNQMNAGTISNIHLDNNRKLINRRINYAPTPMSRELLRASAVAWSMGNKAIEKGASGTANSVSLEWDDNAKRSEVFEIAKTPGDEKAERKMTASLNRAENARVFFVSDSEQSVWSDLLLDELDILAKFTSTFTID